MLQNTGGIMVVLLVLSTELRVTDADTLKSNRMPLKFGTGMLGVLPVFESEEAANRYAKRIGVESCGVLEVEWERG